MLMDRIATVIVTHSRRVLALTGLITLLSIGMFLRLDFNADVTSFLLEGNERGEAFAALQDKYETADPINVLVALPDGESFTSPENLALLAELRDAYAATDGVKTVGMLLPDVNPLTGAPLTPDDVRALPGPVIQTLLDSNPLSSLLLTDDGANTLAVVVPEGDGLELARALPDVPVPDGLEVILAGNPVIFASVIGLLGWFLLVLPPAVMALLLLTFYSAIGDRRLTIMAVIPALVGSIWTFGTLFGLGREIDIVTVIVPIFVIVMGSADGLHFVTHFQEVAGKTSDPVERVASALREVGVPMILTTVSTAAGFLSLLATDVRPIRQMGVFVAIGITYAGIISFFALPAIVSRIDIQPRHTDSLIGPRIVSVLQKLVTKRQIAFGLLAALVIFAAVFIPRIEVDSDQLFFFKDNHEVRLAFQALEEVFGGATPLTGEFVYDPADGLAGLESISGISRDMEALPGVKRVFSAADLTSLPPEQLQRVLSEQVALPLGDMVSDDGLRFVLFTEDFTPDDLQGWVGYADTHDEVRILTGMPILWDETARLVLRAQVGSVIAAFVLVSLMLLLAYRRVRDTLIAMVPIALTVGVLLGFIAAAGIGLNLITAIVSGIVIGVGIDYSIHYIAAINHERDAGPGYVLRAIEKAGRPIVANALGIAIALTALWISPLKPHGQISMIMWVSMLTAAATALLIIPALLPKEAVER